MNEEGRRIECGSSKAMVSIIIPAYNAEPFFEECLSSVENQTYRNIEIIVVDDGSTDSTYEIARKHAAVDSRVKVISQDNQYAGVARNNGMALALGEFLLFFDADDILDACAVELLVARATETFSDVVVCRSTGLDVQTGFSYPLLHALHGVDYEGVVSGFDLRSCLFQNFVGWPWDKLFRRSFVEEQHLRFQPLRTTNDAFFVFMALALSSGISFVDSSLVTHRVSNCSSLEGTRNKSFNNAIDAAKAIREELVRRGLYGSFEGSYLNWLIDFSVWNYRTLEGASKDAYYSLIVSDVAPLLQGVSEGDFFLGRLEKSVASILTDAESSSCAKRRAIDLVLDYDELLKRLDELEEEKAVLLASNDQLRACLSEEKNRNREIVNSTTYKVGGIVTRVPCAIKDAIRSR